jgi:phosphoribosylanthranilate isomerase
LTQQLANRGQSKLVLAGGLSHLNVAAAIGALHPDVVDVSSGVESEVGVKDHEKMRLFMGAVRSSGGA